MKITDVIKSLKTLKTYNSIEDYCKGNFTYINKGSSRKVYKINNTYVLKIAYNWRGNLQNITEIINYFKFGSEYMFELKFNESCFINSTGLWIISKYRKGKHFQTFKEFTNVPFSVIHYAGLLGIHSDEIMTNTLRTGKRSAWVVDYGFTREVDKDIKAYFCKDKYEKYQHTITMKQKYKRKLNEFSQIYDFEERVIL